MIDYENLKLKGQLCFALYAAANAITRAYRASLRKVGLTYPQYLVLLALWEADVKTVNGIAQRLYLDSAALTPLLKRLERTGLIVRQRSVKDERVVNVSLTAEGRALKNKAPQIQAAVSCQTGLSLTEMVKLRNNLHQLVATLGRNQQRGKATAKMMQVASPSPPLEE